MGSSGFGIRWNRSRGLTNALLNRRDEFRAFAEEEYTRGLEFDSTVDRNQRILAEALATIGSSSDIDGVLLCSASVCFYDLYGSADTASRVLRQLDSRLEGSDVFQDKLAYIREGEDLFRFYFIAEDFPVARFFGQ